MATDLIIWDEAPMQSRHIHEAVDRIFKALIIHLEVCVLSLEETLSRYFLLSSKEIGLKSLESLYSALLFGSPFRFSNSHKICGLIQQMNTSANLHNGSWILGMDVTQMKMEILFYWITFTAGKTPH